jgi:hypothetical protein
MFQYFETFNRVKKVANFSIATSEIYRDSNGEKQSETTWHRLVARGKQADIVENYLKKVRKMLLRSIVPQYFKHVFHRLFGAVNVIHKIAGFVAVNNYMFGCRNEAVFDSAVSADGILVSAGVEKAQVKRLFFARRITWQHNLLVQVFGVVII